MKTVNNFPFSLKSALSVMLLATAFTACKKDKNDDPPVNKTAKVSVIHAAPGSPELFGYLNNVDTKNKTLTYGTALDYVALAAGKSEYSVKKKDVADPLVKGTIDLTADKSYSLFVVDIPTKLGLAIFEDNLTAPAADKARLRFINVSPDAGSLDLAITGTSTPLLANQAFKTGSAFTDVTPGDALNFEIRTNGQAAALATLANVKIEKGKIYTIWVKGLKTTADDASKLGLAIFTNK